MTKIKPLDAMTKIVEILTPLPSEERVRIIRAASALLGEVQLPAGDGGGDLHADAGDLNDLSPRARTWMKQNTITLNELLQVFHMTKDGAEVIAAHIPGKNRKEQTYNAYILAGIAQLLHTGNPSFQDKPARALCESSGCYDRANHSIHLKNKGNEFTGTKERGWTLTAPGLKRGAELIKELNKPEA
jgi:hypothetical protein